MLKGYGTRDKGTLSLYFSWILTVVGNVKAPLSSWCTYALFRLCTFVVTLTRCYHILEAGMGKMFYVNIMWRNYQYVHNDNIRQ